ncbi:hypothetical protein B0O99DRAFT_695681 [Bisporella sp. PMI_857]|nr:hypothetical protein B0O99DRAFT_695681 [Bisporella sp. PMI_857]
MAPTHFFTWRIQNIPSNFNETRLKSCFHSDDRKYIDIKSLTPDVNNYDGDGTLTATMLFSSPEPREPRTDDSTELDIDKDFIGFTPLNAPDRDVCADIIAVTGLAGHAFGSWAQSDQKMWLRDYLPRDIQNRARILIYGYESQLHDIHAPKAIVSDYGNSFLQTLMDLRDHPSCRDRPLILIGHSLGALIIKQVITDLIPSIRSRLPVRTLLFFGAPHNGLEVEALETLVKGRPTQTLISELKFESPTLAGLSDRFRHVAKDLTIHTYYESRPTRTVAQGTDGKWERIGEPLVMVQKSSALLNMDSEKTQMKVDGDHKDIAKLRRGQGGVYPNVLRIIKDALQSASEQFTAATRISEARQENNQPKDNQQDTIGSHDQNQDQDAESEGEYDESNLICEVCYDEFPKYQKHYHCYICGDGNFNICQSCKTSKTLCPGKHKMIERQLENPDESDDASSYEEDDNDNYLMCNACEESFLKD